MWYEVMCPVYVSCMFGVHVAFGMFEYIDYMCVVYEVFVVYDGVC